MEDNYLLEEDGDSYYICFRNEKRAERLRQILGQQKEGRPKKKIDIKDLLESVGYLLVSLSIFSFPFWLALAGMLMERWGW